jgi:hypothetical protein
MHAALLAAAAAATRAMSGSIASAHEAGLVDRDKYMAIVKPNVLATKTLHVIISLTRGHAQHAAQQERSLGVFKGGGVLKRCEPFFRP